MACWSRTLTLLVVLLVSAGQFTRCDVGNQGAWGDQGDGTFINPILPGDFSDPDVIRVGADYYLITSTFQYQPGMAILHSTDLVNWRYLGHCIPDVATLGPELNWDRMNRYNRGVYAGALRYHAGKFWMYFTTMDEGVFLTTAERPEGPWSQAQKVADLKNRDDPCPFWDDDGKAYLLLSTPGREWFTHLYRMASDGQSIDLASDRAVDDFQTSEGNKLYKIGGTYFIFHNEVRSGRRVGVMMRSGRLEGPWEKKTILEDAPGKMEMEPNQGGLVQTPKGDWWFITHQGKGAWEGRASSLLPVRWIDGWPIPGTPDQNGAGNIAWHVQKPIEGSPPAGPQTSDEFTAPAPGPQWEWNYQPRADKWSLAERPGWLRLYAFKPLSAGNFFKAGNTLSQRVTGYSGGTVEAKLDAARLADGQIAGLVFYWKNYAQVGVTQREGKRRVIFNDNGTVTEGPELPPGNMVWVQAVIDEKAGCTFGYSFDGRSFLPIGRRFAFGWHNYRGTRLGLFTYNDAGENGLVDFDCLHYRYRGPGPLLPPKQETLPP